MFVRVQRRDLQPLVTGGAGGGNQSTFGVDLGDHEEIVAITEHMHRPQGGGGEYIPPIFSYSAWIIPRRPQ